MKIERSQVRPVPFDSPLNKLQQAFVNSTKENGPPPGGTCDGAREVDTNVLFGDTPKTANRPSRSYPAADLRSIYLATNAVAC
jgi:hypothetical protein